MNRSSILTVLHEARIALKRACKDHGPSSGALDFINTLDFSVESMNTFTGCVPTHSNLLDSAISNIPDEQFTKLKSALTTAKIQLHWRVDDGGFYADGVDVGDGYKNGNMHALLIGPKDCPILADDFLFGFFLLAPQTLYRDHRHLAPEIYVPLTGPNGWRFELGDWVDYDAGSMIYNQPDVIHATRVYGIPFLSLFAWTRDTGYACSVVPADDWEDIQARLTASSECEGFSF